MENKHVEQRWFCPCNWMYDPAVGEPSQGVAPGTPWEKLPAGFHCPKCGVDSRGFVKKDVAAEIGNATPCCPC